MPFNPAEFRARGLPFGGARSNQFTVDIFTPFGSPNNDRVQLSVRAATIPPSTLGSVRVPYFGRATKFAGDREFAAWSVTMYNDDDQAIRVMMERWSNEINAMRSNIMSEAAYPTAYKSGAIVTQYTKIGGIARQWELTGLWPVEVSAIGLDWDVQNQIQQFDVTFEYDEWAPYGNESNTLADDYNPIVEAVDGIG